MIERLPNGLTLGFRQLPGRQTARVCVASRMGSRYEKEDERGLIHFCEHALLGGTKAISSAEVKKEIELLGGGFNAFTSHDMISIEGDFTRHDCSRALDLVGELFFHPAFPKAFVDQERKVILQEIAMNRDDPWDTVSQGAYDLFYRGKGVGAAILGDEEALKTHNVTRVRNYWKRVSATSNSLIYMVGNLTEADMKYARERYADLPKTSGRCARKTTVYAGKRSVDTQDKDQVYVSILFEAPELEDQKGCIQAEVLSAVLGAGMNSRIWKRVREKMGAAYDARSSFDVFRRNGHLELSAALDPKKWEKAMDAMVDELRKVAHQKPPSKREVDCAVKGLVRSTTIMADDPLVVADYDMTAMAAGCREFTFDRRKDLISQVNQQGVRDIAASIFDSGEPTVQVLGPVDSDFFS